MNCNHFIIEQRSLLIRWHLFQLAELKQHNITHIVCIRQDSEAHFVKPKYKQDFEWVLFHNSMIILVSGINILMKMLFAFIRYLVLNIADQIQENIITQLPLVSVKHKPIDIFFFFFKSNRELWNNCYKIAGLDFFEKDTLGCKKPT